eukprot:CAMPEP_0117454886 /NCGR_PEP_ID=MMETSP0759-20121206/11053_1 /TAXON_ID=63605 /ORGANISM="Percolomonas cosmopolitus, Strain WS" /LENGTH=169 /DNA_ID=CAMNT_0005248129 /DNA_START=273 /DNA_END=782 /DNA_ORIENTATION=-
MQFSNPFSSKPPPQNPDVKATQLFIRDITAASMLTDCRKEALDALKARYASDMYSQNHVMNQLFHCMNRYMMNEEIGVWRTGIKEGRHYWYQTMTRWPKTQWERPEVLQEAIDKGKENKDYPEKWCEFLHIALLTCEQQYQEHAQFKCIHQHQKLNQCMAQRLGGADEF